MEYPSDNPYYIPELNNYHLTVGSKLLYFGLLFNLPGYNQSPFGNLALTSIFPYLKENLSFVVNCADRIGGRI